SERKSVGVCTTNLQAGVITSPNYPQPYPRDLLWAFNIDVPQGCSLRLNFREFRKFSEFNWRLMCFQLGDDYVNITNDTGSFGSWTGSENPPQIQSSATLLVALQTSDDGTLNPGYLANYSQKDRSENEVTRNESFYACCSTLSSGNVTSPGYPNAYPNRLRYTWIIVQPLGCVIQLNFSDF
ncbi:hypothetical protein T265_15519, partial [Opisthorchis viverrini]